MDFRCDVDIIVKKTLPASYWVRFCQAYILYDSLDPVDIELHADKIFGPKRHRFEQRLGFLFYKHGVYPTKKYFTVIKRKTT